MVRKIIQPMDVIRLGRALKALRIHKGQRQEDVASAAGVRQQVVSDLQGGVGR